MVTISLDGNSSKIKCEFEDPIDLDKNFNYEICLLNFSTYNSIPNVSEKLKNNVLTYINKNEKDNTIEIIDIVFPTGSYEIENIHNYIDQKLGIQIRPNLTTLKVEIYSKLELDLTKENSIGKLLGFSKQIIPIRKKVSSDLPVDIMKVNTIRIKCDIASGSYENKKLTNIIHEFVLTDNPGEKINEIPKNLIYFPITRHSIREIEMRVVDQDGDLIDFRNEKISIRLHIRKMI
jgi:hypothetical protein